MVSTSDTLLSKDNRKKLIGKSAYSLQDRRA
jgi:hypothetical protein